MRDHSNHIEFSRENAISAMLDACGFAFEFPTAAQQSAAGKADQAAGKQPDDKTISQRSEILSLTCAYGRVLAEDVCSRVMSPSVLTCCMDSVAVHWSAFEDGKTPDYSTWKRGEDWEFANTGIAMPEGFDTAVVIEHVKVSDDEQHIEIDAAPSKQFAGTRAPGETMQVGDVLASAGTIITPDVAAAIAAGNISHVRVMRRPRVAFIPTGNELIPPAVPMRHDGKFAGLGKNFETNSILIKGRVEQWGGTCHVFDIVPDDPALIEQAIHEACQCADIVVLNAGSSKGSDDWSCEQMEKIGKVLFHETNHGPGHHSSFAMVDDTPVVGISGPARGASFTLNFYLQPLIKGYLGLSTKPRTAWACLDEEFPKKHKKPSAEKKEAKTIAGEERPSIVKADRKFFGIKPVYVEYKDDGKLHATPVKGSNPQVVANAIYMLSSDPDSHPLAGSIIEIEWR